MAEPAKFFDFINKPWEEWPFLAKASAVGLGAVVVKKALEAGKTENATFAFCKKIDKSRLTYDPVRYAQLSDAIQAAVWLYYDGVFEDDTAIKNALLECYTDEDVLKLICEYGIRGPLVVGLNRDLISTVQNYLDSGKKEDVNEVYQSRGIQLLWL